MRILAVFSVIFALVLSQSAMAGTKEDIKNLVEKRINIVINTLKDKSLKKSARNRKIIDTVVPFFDFEFMAKVCLGKKHWRSISKPQQEEFTSLFVKRLQEFYLEKLDLFSDQKVTVEKAKKRKSRIYVISYIISDGDKMKIIYKFRENKRKKEWKVYDMEVLGVSVVQTYRSQFSGFLKKNSFDDLLKKLRTKGGFGDTGIKKEKS